MTPKMALVLQALRDNIEGGTTTLSDGRVYHSVYLDNARPAGMSPRAFAGHLSALEKIGAYRSIGDDCFGDVLTFDPTDPSWA